MQILSVDKESCNMHQQTLPSFQALQQCSGLHLQFVLMATTWNEGKSPGKLNLKDQILKDIQTC